MTDKQEIGPAVYARPMPDEIHAVERYNGDSYRTGKWFTKDHDNTTAYRRTDIPPTSAQVVTFLLDEKKKLAEKFGGPEGDEHWFDSAAGESYRCIVETINYLLERM
jgi:hypothetical protein